MSRHGPRQLSTRLLSLLLYLYPRRFRQQFGDELLALHRRRLSPPSTAPGSLWQTTAPLLHTLFSAPLAWRDAWRRHQLATSSHGDSSMAHLLHEARLTARVLLTRQRSFTALCVLTLALGLGAVTAIFSIVHGVLLAPLPYGEPERIVRLFQQPPDQGFGVFSAPNFNDLRDRLQSFEVIAAYDDYRPEGIDLTGGDRVERLRVLRVGAGYFATLGVEPVMGRTFSRHDELPVNLTEFAAAEATETPDDDIEPVMTKSVVLSHRFWRRHFAGSPTAVGARLQLNQESFEVVGIMPAGIGGHLGGSPDLWLPHNLADGGRNSRGNLYMSVIGRLAPGVTFETALAELRQATLQLRQEHPRANADVDLSAAPLDDIVLGPSRTMLWILFAAVGAMLAIACINVANLFLARGLGQRRELGIRNALGAGGRRLFAGALLESLWIGAAGGLLGLAAAWFTIDWLHTLRPAALPRFDALAINRPVFAFSLAAVMVTVMFFGLVPALRASKTDVGAAFGERGGVSVGGRRDRRIRDMGVSLQVALSLVLLSAGALLGRSFLTLQGTDMGFETDRALTFQLRLPDYAYDEPERRIGFYEDLFDHLDALPEVATSGATSKLPGNGHRNHWVFFVDGRERVEGQPWDTAEIRCITGKLFESLAIPVLTGRALGPQDRQGTERVVVVNQALADAYFAGDSALGERLHVASGDPRTIVGIVGNARHDPRQEAVPKIYVPQSQFADDRNWDLTFVATRPQDTEFTWNTLRSKIEGAVAKIDPRLIVYDFEPLAEVTAEPIARQRFAAQLMVIFAALSLLLAAVGLFGALAYSLAQRRAEIGVRMALGADRRSVLFSVLGHGLRVFALGSALGLSGAFVAARWLRSQLHEVEPYDPLALLVAFVVLFLAAAVAAIEPARRASKLDPAKILHEA